LRLDALRGLAAIAVFLGHAKVLGPNATFGLAVDLFFMLSGFVIAHAYERRLDDGLSLRAFALIRLVRLYPSYAIGVLFGVALLGVETWLGVRVLPADWPDLPPELILLPAAGAAGAFLYPLNPPAWSLFYELASNVFFASASIVRSTRFLLAQLALCAGVMLVASVFGGSTALLSTWGLASVISALAHVGFGFAAGVLAYRFRQSSIVRGFRLNGWVVLAAFAILFCVPVPPSAQAIETPVAVLLLLPALFLCAVNVPEPAGRQVRIAAALGSLSYPLYAVHYPLIYLANAIAITMGISRSVKLLIAVPVIMAIALVIDRAERAIRARLTCLLVAYMRLNDQPHLVFCGVAGECDGRGGDRNFDGLQEVEAEPDKAGKERGATADGGARGLRPA
jgi:peptidoglycan/LPS O-acetylase OafA/YrhL